jgi:polyribonucleotide nucleotidyltransferase
MVEGGANEAPESEIVEGLRLAHESAQPLLQMQEEMARQQGKPKREPVEQAGYQSLLEFLRATVSERLAAAYRIRNKLERYQALDEAKRVALEAVAAHPTLALASEWVSSALEHLKSDWVRRQILDTHQRMDGRSLVDIRPISSEVGLLPRTHGSALFTRGETQALVSVTLGTRQDEQKIDDLLGEHYRSFMLHYNFPPYSVGETKFLRGPGRREIGHGALAERALAALVETSESFPYVVRVMSDILESNGSSSMATVCGGSLALMDAGVPIRRPCAGIAMGLIKEGEDVAILSDILGDEDHLGDMDFKVARTEVGITAIQMDIKINGLSWDLLVQALEQAKGGCLHILKCMESTLTAPRTDLSEFAPRITTFRIKTDRIRDVIGPGGKIIKDIVARTGCQINIEDDGLVQVASNNGESSRQAVKMIMDLTQEAEVGKQYLGCVRKIVEYGAFIEIFPGTEGLVHISELAFNRVDRVEDLLAEGDEVVVKVVGIEKGKVRLSLKQALLDQPPAQDPLPPA